MTSLEQLQYPIGRFKITESPTAEQVQGWVADIASFPALIQDEVNGLSEDSLQWKYRRDGWSILQVINHCCDSHMNSMLRFKTALTEEDAVIRPYRQSAWAALPDGKADLSIAIQLITGLHQRWTHLLRNLSASQWERTIYHPEHDKNMTLQQLAGMYSWHCRHHFRHIQLAIETKGHPQS